jgi:TolA-binding protein
LQKFPKSDSVPRALYAKALAEHRLKRFEPALRDAEAYLATGPQGDEALDARLLRGLCQEALGRHEAAAGTLREIVQANPKYSQADRAYYEMAFALWS